jgi:hypothetical protein
MRDIIEALKADTDQFRDGAEQNDDLTMLAFRITNKYTTEPTFCAHDRSTLSLSTSGTKE